MRVSCPACNAELSLDVLLTNDEARAAMARLATASVPLGGLVLRYLALFRPPKRRLSIERMTSLLLELLPDIERGFVTRKGREWSVELDTWRCALEQMLAQRDAGKLTLPLASHAYLYEVIVGMAYKLEALHERNAEAARKARPHVGGTVTVDAALLPRIGEVPSEATVPPLRAPAGPSRLAAQIKADIEARRARKEGAADGEQD